MAARFVKKSKKEIGLPPDALVFRGKKKIEKVLLRIIDFDANNLEESAIQQVKDAIRYKDKKTVTWLNIDGLHNTEIIEEIRDGFQLNSMVLAGVMDTQSRPKVQEYDNCVFISLKMLQQNEETGVVSVENLSLIMTKSVLISFQERKGDVFDPVRERIRKQRKRIRTSGTDFLAFALMDIVVDNYIYIISVLGEKIETLEENLLQEPNQSVIDEINAYKRELNFLRKNIKPAREAIQVLSKLDSELIHESTYVYYKELLDNINQANEASDTYREILSDQLNIYHTTISSKLNDIMKFLTVFSVIFIPLTFIAGIYGTNFDTLPELHYEYSYYVMLTVMIILAIAMLFYFKKKKWL